MSKPFETPSPIPEENELPLNLAGSEAAPHQGGESAIWKALAQTPEGREKLIALKEVRENAFDSDEDMKASKQFYDHLVSSPLGRFIPDTLYFKAQMNREEGPRSYRLQKFIEGKRVDEISDEEIANDPEVARQLIDFIDAVAPLLQEGREENIHTPDLYGQKFAAAILHNPRYSNNIYVSEKPDEKGRRVFFLDTAPDPLQREPSLHRTLVRNIGTRLQAAQLMRWRKKLEEQLGAAQEKSEHNAQQAQGSPSA